MTDVVFLSAFDLCNYRSMNRPRRIYYSGILSRPNSMCVGEQNYSIRLKYYLSLIE